MSTYLEKVSDSKLPPPRFPRAYFRIIGDVHGRIQGRPRKLDRDRDRRLMPALWRDQRLRGRSYLKLVESATYSLQVGDLALDYSELRDVDPNLHRAIAGNHDHMEKLSPHFLGDFGVWQMPLLNSTLDIFFVRGAASVDLPYRVEGLNWWYNEELSVEQMEQAVRLFDEIKPSFVVTHDCPTELVEMLIPGGLDLLPASRTNDLLQTMFERHAPQWWFFGHHHKNLTFQHPRGTRFVCLASLAYFDFDETGRSVSWKPE